MNSHMVWIKSGGAAWQQAGRQCQVKIDEIFIEADEKENRLLIRSKHINPVCGGG